MRKILFVVNPAAGGNGSAKKMCYPSLKKVCEGHKINYEIKVSNRKKSNNSTSKWCN